MDCRVVVEAAVPVYDVETEDEAIRIAISKTGDMLNPDLNYVENDKGSRESPTGEELSPAFIAADEALVALELEMTVFNVEREEHASRIARKEIGQRLENVPLKVLEVEQIESEEDEEDDAADDESSTSDADESSTSDADADEGSSETDESDDATGSEDADEEDLIPEFEELVDE